MTAKEARGTLPDVKIRINGEVHIGHTRGRLNDFASVFVPGVNIGAIEYSWGTIAHSVTNGSELLV